MARQKIKYKSTQQKTQHLAVKLYALFQAEWAIFIKQVYDLALDVRLSFPLLTCKCNHFDIATTIVDAEP
jgi:hypothetical protein